MYSKKLLDFDFNQKRPVVNGDMLCVKKPGLSPWMFVSPNMDLFTEFSPKQRISKWATSFRLLMNFGDLICPPCIIVIKEIAHFEILCFKSCIPST
jgi:hypothetical protein